MPIKRLISISILFLSLCLTPVLSNAQKEPSKKISIRGGDKISAILGAVEAQIPEAMKKEGIPGLAMALVDDEGIVWARGFGTTQKTGGTQVDLDTIFGLQSLTKAVTATGILHAVQNDLLDLDVPITRYIPSFQVNSRWEKDPEKKMTLRFLLSHRCGFTHAGGVGSNVPPASRSFHAYLSIIPDTWLRYPVGQRHSYSTMSYDLAGWILQTAADKPFAQYMKENILRPLEMTSSSYDIEEIRKTANRAAGHSRFTKDIPLEIPLVPSGGLYSSVADLAKFIRLQLNRGQLNGKSFIQEKLLEDMAAIQFPLKGQVQGYGLGVRRYPKNGSYYIGHTGMGYGFMTNLIWYPEYGIGAVVLTNSDSNSMQSAPVYLLDAILKGRTGKSAPKASAKEPKDTVSLKNPERIAGQYIGSDSEITVVYEKDQFIVKAGGKEAGFLTFFSDSEAVLTTKRGTRYNIRFVFKKNGFPSHYFVLDQGLAFDYNGGPSDPPGPDKPEWDAYTGSYSLSVFDKHYKTYTLHKKNGTLYFDNLKLDEYKPGLFFSSTGEALDLRGEYPTWMNLRLEKK